MGQHLRSYVIDIQQRLERGRHDAVSPVLTSDISLSKTRRLHRRSLRLPTRRKWAQSGYLCTTPSTAQAGADAGISWS